MATLLGTVIDGKYEVLKQIGKGGMSVVYLAMDKRLNKQWAVKEIRKTANGKNDEIIVNSLLAEANLMKKLDHTALPRIVDIIDNGETIYVVMDYIEGESLDKILEEYGAQPQELVIEWAKQLCGALDYLHTQKPPIIYRDMKPANVMLKPDGNLKVIDFGIAREYKEKNLADTTVLGTRGYAPPEQHGSRQTDARSDIYALGMTMHHLLTGIDPRPSDYEYIPIRQWNPELSDGLERIIDKCTALDPRDRYQNCGDLMYALQHYEEESEDFKKKQKRKLAVFVTAAAFTAICLVVGIGGRLMSSYVNNQDYDQKISISSSTPYETKVETYLEAIDLFGTDARAYIKLLEAYRDNNLFGDEESQQFTAKYNSYKDSFDTESEDYLELAYEAGITYFYLYSGGDDTFRTRVLKAYPYFQTIVDSGNTDYEYYDISQSYYIVGEFYEEYVVSATSVREPTQEAYEELLASLQDCIDNVENYDYDDAAYIKLTMYEAIADLLNSHRKGFASVGIEEDEVLGLLDTVYEKTNALSVTQERSVEVRDSILDSYEGYVSNIERAYTNTEGRN
ncbi:MAG: serine/threonine protein kinase [Clostridiales bacterium]|nr:serine/threonine protein kinase [Clostridiales bacterium]